MTEKLAFPAYAEVVQSKSRVAERRKKKVQCHDTKEERVSKACAARIENAGISVMEGSSGKEPGAHGRLAGEGTLFDGL